MMKNIIKLLESKGILKDLPNDRSVAAVSLAMRISKDEEITKAFSEFAFNYTITSIVDRLTINRMMGKKDIDDLMDELFNEIINDIMSCNKKEKEGK